MLARLIRLSIDNRILVLVVAALLSGWGWVSMQNTPLDAIPDLSDVQVIIRTSWPGQSPRVVEDQLTYPITTTMLAVPGAEAVRGYSFFGDSYVYVVFADGTDLYWARSRVREYLDQASGDLPPGVNPRLGPDATGVGWIYSYALLDRSGRHDLAELRSLQDWFLKPELQTVPGVAEVASVGGMVRQYQVITNPELLRAYGIPLQRVAAAIRKSNGEVGGSVVELAEAEYMIHTRGFLRSLEDIERIPVDVSREGVPVFLRDIATVQVGPEMRRAVADLDGEGEVAGGIVVMRHGHNALSTIEALQRKLSQLQAGLPAGVEIVTTYDRSGLIRRAVANLSDKLVEEFIVVALASLLFLLHLRSALVAVLTLPLGILLAFIVMRWQGINANIMSLGGIAIAIGAMVDAAVVMIENAHKHLERWQQAHPGETPDTRERWQLITVAATETGPALFLSLLIITLSFLPVFSLQAEEGRLFSPLAFTKTYAMAAAAALSVTLVPVLMGYLIRGRIPRESANPLNRGLIRLYRPLLQSVLSRPGRTLLVALLLSLSMVLPAAGVGGLLAPLKWPASLASLYAGPEAVGAVSSSWIEQVSGWQARLRDAWRGLLAGLPPLARLADGLGSEFMPELFEGDLMYMPTTLPGLSIGKARQLLQQTDRLIAAVPEVERVFGKIGRADTATDPAPLTMIETIIQLKPRTQWRPGLTLEGLIGELDRRVDLPGLTNAWLMPIRTRIDMLATGIKTPVGIRVSGPELKVIERIGRDIERILGRVRGTASVYSERVTGGRYIEILPDRDRAGQLGLTMEDINQVVRAAVGGINVTSMVEGNARYPLNLRFAREVRDDPEELRELPLLSPSGVETTLGEVADVRIVDGPPMLKSENARLSGWTFVDLGNVDLGGYVRTARQVLEHELELPPGYSITWTGQYRYLLRAGERLARVIPLTLTIIFLLLYLTFRSVGEALLVMLTLPFALIGGFWLMFALGYHLSVAAAVGFIALAGVAAEFGVIMLVYLDRAVEERRRQGRLNGLPDLKAAIMEGAVQRVRPKAMTVAVVIGGLIPVMIGSGTGSEVMQRIAAPMIGGMITAPLLSLFVIPAVYLPWKARRLPAEHR
ncbi:MAG TPA: efflux RND transporter permease subunit [Gammaproteobacteria bacterium]|nr:efflux RND transporter permease subunit [Gammaproteobacteria bacterium]